MIRISRVPMALVISSMLTIGCQSNPQTTGHYIDDAAITTTAKTHLATDGPLKTMMQISIKTVKIPSISPAWPRLCTIRIGRRRLRVKWRGCNRWQITSPCSRSVYRHPDRAVEPPAASRIAGRPLLHRLVDCND